jgi:hypothetical protein
MQNVNGLGTDDKIREACKTVRGNHIPCTAVLETHRCFDQCLEHGNITFLGHGSGDVKSRTKGVGALVWGEGLEAWKGAQCYKHHGRSGSFFSFGLKYEAMTSYQPSTFRNAAPAAGDKGSIGQCYHIIAGYAPTTAHTNAECEEYYDELDEHIAKKRHNDILIHRPGSSKTQFRNFSLAFTCLGSWGAPPYI